MFARAGLDLAEAACERVLHGDTLSDAARRTCLANAWPPREPRTWLTKPCEGHPYRCWGGTQPVEFDRA